MTDPVAAQVPMARPKIFTRPIAVADLTLAKKRAETVLKIFVAGPFINKSWDPASRLAAPQSAQLRMHLIELIEGMNHEVVIGEHRGVAEMAETNFRSKASVMLSEIALATDDCHAIIIVPDSPSSFCELGSWVMLEGLCRKMLILGHADYQNAISYVGTGVFKAAEDEGARVKWVDYSDHANAGSSAAEFIHTIQDTTLARRIKSGRG